MTKTANELIGGRGWMTKTVNELIGKRMTDKNEGKRMAL